MTKGKPIAGSGRIECNLSGDLRLFEINFIAGRARKLKRQVRFGRWSSGVAVVMLLVAAWLLFNSVGMLTWSWNKRNKILLVRSQIADAKLRRKSLDMLRDSVASQVKHLLPMVPVAGARVSWAPKLNALARQLPARMGVSRVEIAAGNLFPEVTKDEKARSKRGDKETPTMHFTVVYEQVKGDEDPIGRLLDNLRGDDDFMYKMEVADLEGVEAGAWNNRPVVFFRGVVKGAISQP